MAREDAEGQCFWPDSLRWPFPDRVLAVPTIGFGQGSITSARQFLVCGLPDKTQVGREGLNIIGRQFARDFRHRCHGGGMKSFAPLLKFPL